MTQERLQATLEDISEVETRDEMKIYEELLKQMEGGNDPAIAAAIEAKRKILDDPTVVLAQYMVQLAELKSEAAPQPKVSHTPVQRTGRKYRLLNDEVNWSTTPQVHAIMLILKSLMKVGDVVDEAEIVEAMEKNVDVLNTTQPAKRIWDYYKGKSDKGLQAHGNVEQA